MKNFNKYLSSFLIIAAVLVAASSQLAMAQSVPPLGAADSFAVLGGTAVTATGSAVISGNVGVSPGTAVTGFPPAVVQNGQIYTGVGLSPVQPRTVHLLPTIISKGRPVPPQTT